MKRIVLLCIVFAIPFNDVALGREAEENPAPSQRWPERVLDQLRRIYAPVVVGIPPSNPWHDLMQLPNGEIRHYGDRHKGKDVRPIYISSKDCGLSWQEFPRSERGPGACVQSPWSGDWLTVFAHPGTCVSRSSEGVDGPFTVQRISGLVHDMPRQPLALRHRHRWIVATAVANAADKMRHPVVFYSDDDGHTWQRTMLETVAPHKVEWPHAGMRWQNFAAEPTADGKPLRFQSLMNMSTVDQFASGKFVGAGKIEAVVSSMGMSEQQTIDVPVDSSPMLQVFSPMGIEEMGMNLQDIFGGMMPKKMKKRKTTVPQAFEILTQQEAQKLIDMEEVVREATKRVENSGIVFLDEIDKIVGASSGKYGPDVSREGVQRDLLPVVEGTSVATKYGVIKSDHILFIASGAFNVSKPSDLIPELQGRFPIRVELTSLSENDFIRILTEPENALIKQYTALLDTEDVKLSFTNGAIKEIARIATQVNTKSENIGARRLHTIMSTLLEEYLFNVPEMDVNSIKIDANMVKEKLEVIMEDEDLSKYIL